MLKLGRCFTATEKKHPYDGVNWIKRDAIIRDKDGNTSFEQKGVTFPDFWSDTAVNIVVNKYFYGHVGTEDREDDLRTLINRVVNKISEWAEKEKYFDSESLQIFKEELTYMLVHQIFCFNSPLWFNIGTPFPQVSSACYINELKDDMGSILDMVRREGRIFQAGSGSGMNVSNLRAENEKVAGRGRSSGPVSFMKL